VQALARSDQQLHIYGLRRSLMAYSLRLETLNIWGGRLYHALLAHIRRQADNVDIFCFQEVYMTQSDHLWARDDFAPPSPLRVSVR